MHRRGREKTSVCIKRGEEKRREVKERGLTDND